jgi:predicted aspartyl protease
MRLSAAITFVCCYTLTLDAADRTRFRLRDTADIVVEVTIAGHGPFRVLLDTGSSRSGVSETAARRLRQPRIARTLMLTPSGHGMRDLIRVPIEVGPFPATEVDAMVLSASELGAGIDGLLGQDVLGGVVYTIDYRRREIAWHGTEPPGDDRATRLLLEEDDGRLLAVLPQRASRLGSLRAIPDSGTDGWVFFTRAGRALPDATPRESVALRTLTGRRPVQRVIVDAIDVGTIRLEQQPAVLIESDGSEPLFGDALLPLHLFEKVTINGPGRYMLVTRW